MVCEIVICETYGGNGIILSRKQACKGFKGRGIMTTISIVLLIVYLVSSAAIAWKIYDICHRPERYKERELEDRARALEYEKKYCWFFKSLSHQYSMVNLIFMFLLMAVAYGVIVACSYLTAGQDTVILLDTQFVGLAAMLFINIILGMLIVPLHFKTPFFAVSVNDFFDVDSRYDIYKRGFTVLLIFFALLFPFYGLGCNNYAHYDDAGIVTSKYFQIGETYTAYDEIEEVVIYVHHDNSGNWDVLHYQIRLSDGKLFDINDVAGSNGRNLAETTFEIHKLIEQHASFTPTITPLTESDWQYISTRSAEQAAAIRYIFEGFHK